MNELALYAGAGGGQLASQWLKDWRTVCYVEKEQYDVEVLKARIRDGHLDDAPIWDDAATFDGRPWRGCVDIISAGFPCGPFSAAGNQKADTDERNMWPDTIRIIREVKPEWAFLENVAVLLSVRDSNGETYFGQILKDLAEGGYDAVWAVLPAYITGAPQVGKRLWIVVSPSSKRLERVHQEGNRKYLQPIKTDVPGYFWQTTPGVFRTGNGMANRMERTRAIGNGQVPDLARTAWDLLKGIIDNA